MMRLNPVEVPSFAVNPIYCDCVSDRLDPISSSLDSKFLH